jgi:hypothetical protein
MKKGRFLNDFEEPPRLLGIIEDLLEGRATVGLMDGVER